MDAAQELARLRALDDAVVVGGRQGEGLGDGIAHQGLFGCPLPLGRKFHRAHADDAALALHEAGDGVLGA